MPMVLKNLIARHSLSLVNKQLLLRPPLIVTTSIELIPILMRLLDVQRALREIDRISPAEQVFSKLMQGRIVGTCLK